jgi:hypothetical protein
MLHTEVFQLALKGFDKKGYLIRASGAFSP